MKKFILVFMALSFSLSCFAMGNRPSSQPTKVGKNPVDVSDIVGRDLNVPALGAIGHVGLWTGAKVIEVLNEPQVVQQNTLANFRARTKYWGAVYYSGWSSLRPVNITAGVPNISYGTTDTPSSMWSRYPERR